MDEENQGKLKRGYVNTLGLYTGLYDLGDIVDLRELNSVRGPYNALIDFYAGICAFSERLLPSIDNYKLLVPKEYVPQTLIKEILDNEKKSGLTNNINIKAADIISYWISEFEEQIDFSTGRIRTIKIGRDKFGKPLYRPITSHINLWRKLGFIKKYLWIAGIKSGALQKQDYERSARAVGMETFR